MSSGRTSFTASEGPRTEKWLLEADAEMSALSMRLSRMAELLKGSRPAHIPSADWHLMKMQFSAMALYHDLLHMRISLHD